MGLQNKFVTLPLKYKDEETTKTHISVISNERNIVKNQVKATNVNGVHTQKCSAETRRRTFFVRSRSFRGTAPNKRSQIFVKDSVA